MSSSGARGRRRSRALALSLAALGCAGARPLPSGESGEEPGLGAVASAEVPSAPKPELPNVPLTTHEGRSVRFYDDLVRGRVVLIYFMFTSCRGICPGTTANVRRVQEALGDRVGRDVFFYAITLDPEVDTPEVLRGYAEAVGAGRG
ncbi:MAG TPA: SCO family protein, partial [Planctomycetota bacterium]|nr:SCO family protein [Planctomycetota bacterium]